MKSMLTTAAALALAAGTAHAQAACEEVTFADVGWTDITATTAATTLVLQALGYETETKVLSVPVTYTSMADGDIDVFLGNWMPTMENDIAPYREDGSVETITYVDGQPQSSETTYPDGSVKTTTYADGQPESSEIVYSDGMVMTSDDLDADGEGEFKGEITSAGTLTLKEDGSGPLSWESADQSQSASWEADGSGTYQSPQGEGAISNTSYDAETGTVTFTDDMNSTGTITSDGTLNLQFSDEEGYGTDDGDVSDEEFAGLNSTLEDETGTESEEESGTGEDSGVEDAMAGAFGDSGESEEYTSMDASDEAFEHAETEMANAETDGAPADSDSPFGEESADDFTDASGEDEELPKPEDTA